MAVKYQFPHDFWWGSATSATQIEGTSNSDGKGRSIWDHWYETEPNRFYQNIGPGVTSDFLNTYKDDIRLIREIGHNTFRISFSWSRLIPEGTGELNQEAVDFYNDLIDELLDNGIEPFVNLYHFDMPMALQEKGGWEARETVEAYEAYAKTAFELFGDKVSKWFTFNEPIVPVEGGYLYDFHYPNKVDAKAAVQVAYNTAVASAKAVKAFHDMDAGNGKIGIILNLTPSYPRSRNPADLKASEAADLFFNRSFLDPSVLGAYPEKLKEIVKLHGLAPTAEPDDKTLLRENTVDILGVNYYQPRRVKAKEHVPNPDGPFLPEWYFDAYVMPGRKMNEYRGWEIYEKGIYDILINLKENYGNIESFISENGMGVQNEERFLENGEIQDDYRIEFVKEHLKWVHRAHQEGANVRGYHMWTTMDNWSWSNAYKNRYGFISVDIETQERTIKKSGRWIKEISEAHGFDE